MADPEILAVPPVEAVEHFRAKGRHVGFDWRDTDAAQHVRSFTVAKAMRLDILEDVRAAVDAAVADGISFREFAERLEPTLRRKGWWGRREMVDPATGERRTVQLGSPRRLRTIFDTNIRMAGAHGRWQRVQRLKDRLPYLRYVAVLDARLRPEHRAWHGVVLPVDHSFWRTHFPPNGWRCRCAAVQLGDDDLERYGYRVSPDPAVRTRPWTNARTGRAVQVPVGIDPGFAHNVGDVARAAEMLDERVAAAPPDVRVAARPVHVEDFRRAGHLLRREILRASGEPGDAGFADRARAEILRRLRDERGAGTVAVQDVRPAARSGRHLPRDREAARRVREAAARFPASWVRAANAGALRVARNGSDAGGFYLAPWDRPRKWTLPGVGGRRVVSVPAGVALLSLDGHAGTALHEYVHHLQRAMPGLQRLFAEEHRRRTARPDGSRDPILPLERYPGHVGQEDDYVDAYFGRRYDGDGGDPLEVLARAMEYTLEKSFGWEWLHELAREDPLMLDLALGVLFHYDP